MRKFITLVFILTIKLSTINAQEMDNKKLDVIINALSEQVEGKNGRWQFSIDSTTFMCLTDQVHNRMRIISPITKLGDMSEDQMLSCMEANFHTALDAKYALSDDILWAVFIHPLKELTQDQVLSALSQVYSCVKTYGNQYSSGSLSFPNGNDRNIRRN